MYFPGARDQLTYQGEETSRVQLFLLALHSNNRTS